MRTVQLTVGPALLLALTFSAFGQEPQAPRVPPESSEAGVNALILIGEPGGEPREGAELDEATQALAKIMRCPVCQALSVADSPSKSALAMKGEIRQLLAVGYTEEQTLEYFERAYGEFIRLEPKAEGFNLVVWAAPLGVLILGAVLVVARVRSQSAPEPVVRAAASDAAADEGVLDQDDELAAYRDQVRREVGS